MLPTWPRFFLHLGYTYTLEKAKTLVGKFLAVLMISISHKSIFLSNYVLDYDSYEYNTKSSYNVEQAFPNILSTKFLSHVKCV